MYDTRTLVSSGSVNKKEQWTIICQLKLTYKREKLVLLSYSDNPSL
jgi:hypothetical protein